MGDDLQALKVIKYVVNSRIYNPLDYYRVVKLREEIIQDLQKPGLGG